MSERRSARSRNTVKYSGFDDDSDDDFANVSPHPAKKSKSSKTEHTAAKKSKKSAKDSNYSLDVEIIDNTLMKSHSANKTRRAPLSEKLYKRELQEALELSLLETGGSEDVMVDFQDNKGLQPEPLQLASDPGDNNQQFSESANIHTEPQPQGSPQNPTTRLVSSLGHIPGTIVLDDSIELLERMNGGSSSKKQCHQQRSSGGQSAKKSKLVDSDGENGDESDFNPDADSDVDEASGSDTSADMSDEDEDKQREIPDLKNKKLTKSRMNKAAENSKASLKSVNNKATNAPKKHQEIASEVNVTKPSSSAHVSSKTSTKTSSSNHPCPKTPSSLVQHWKPPSQASSNKTLATVSSPPSSGLRLGLSRNQRVKPLHPSVRVV